MNNSPKLLGVVLSNGWTSDKQVLTIRQKCQGPLNLLKALCCTGWGCGQETLVMTYKAVGETVITYGAPIWVPNATKMKIYSAYKIIF